MSPRPIAGGCGRGRGVRKRARRGQGCACAAALAGALAVQAAGEALPNEVAPVVVTARPAACGRNAEAIDYACLNTGLADIAESAHARAAGAPLAGEILGTGAPDKVGISSFTGLSQRFGRNLGRSATPYRPSAPTYSSPFAGVAR